MQEYLPRMSDEIRQAQAAWATLHAQLEQLLPAATEPLSESSTTEHSAIRVDAKTVGSLIEKTRRAYEHYTALIAEATRHG